MRDCINLPSCRTCIWNDQCEDNHPCVFYDNGNYDVMDLSDEEIHEMIGTKREQYNREYNKYVKEYDDGRNDE